MVTANQTTASGLANKAVAGLKWTGASAVFQLVFRLISVFAVSRLLSPDQIGLAAAAMVLVPLLTYVTELGLVNAIIQPKRISEQHLRSSLTLLISLGLIALVLTHFAFAPIVQYVFGRDEVGGLLTVGALGLLFRSIGIPSFSATRRNLDFRSIAIVQVSAAAISLAVVIQFAASGFGAVSVMMGFVAQHVIEASAFQVLRPVRPAFGMSVNVLSPLVRFGRMDTAGTVINWIALQLDNILVGSWLGMHSLGIYSRAYQLVSFPSKFFDISTNTVLLPLVSRAQDDHARLSRAVAQGLSATGLVMIPISVVLIVLAPEIITVLLGDTWESAVLPFRLLCLSLFTRAAYKLPTLVFRGIGAMKSFILVQSCYALLIATSLCLCVQFGLAATAAAVATSISALCLLSYGVTCRLLGMSPVRLLQSLSSPLLVSAVCIPFTMVIANAVREMGHPLLTLFVTCGTLGITLILTVVMAPQIVFGSDGMWIQQLLFRRTNPSTSNQEVARQLQQVSKP